MKRILIILGFAASAWSAIGVIACAFLGAPFWAIGLACLAVLLWFVSCRENDAYNEKMEDRMFYQHPRL